MAEKDYLRSQIIAYIGNKRRLLPLIGEALERVFDGPAPGGLKFLDLFAGSGVVSRYARLRGYRVVSNDWEPFTWVLNQAYIGAGPRDVERLFGSHEKFHRIIRDLNELPDPPDEERYLSRYYAPATDDIDEADFRTERLFYTRANALAIDRIRGAVEKSFPPRPGDGDAELRRCLLIAPLLYEAATHTNTSGVFKAFHKGFGGHGRDALKRILSPIVLKAPVLVDSAETCRVFRMDAAELALREEASGADVAYLDPPYNQHQYGSNYHMLNTIALWDKPPAPLELNDKGLLRNKAGIRKDWVNTRSPYCYAETAAAAFGDLLDRLDARRILVSYSSDGIVPWEELESLCRRRGQVGIVANSYTSYRGGRQSNSRGGGNVEFVLTIDTRWRSSSPAGRQEIRRILILREVMNLLRGMYRRSALERHFVLLPGGEMMVPLEGRALLLKSRDGLLFNPLSLRDLAHLGIDELVVLREKLQASVCSSREEELEEIFSRLAKGENPDLVCRVPKILKKLAHKKNRDIFRHWLVRARDLAVSHPRTYGLVKAELDEVERIARLRFQG